jgi:IrrE N-terminal-like domain
LLVGQARGVPGRAGAAQRRQPALAPLGVPAADVLAGHPELVGDLGLGVADGKQRPGPPADVFEPLAVAHTADVAAVGGRSHPAILPGKPPDPVAGTREPLLGPRRSPRMRALSGWWARLCGMANEPLTSTEGFWTNPSVLAFAGDRDPVEAISRLAHHVVLAAVDGGWEGPPFDPFTLADLLGVPLAAHQGLADARTIPHEGPRRSRSEDLAQLLGSEPPAVLIEYNPTRPRGRLRYSLAHEIVHGFFPDVADMARYRTGTGAVLELADSDDWQLELLCNIAAGELLMPTDTLGGLDDQPLDIDMLMTVRTHFDVSAEALLRRVAAQTLQPVAIFAASRISGNNDKSPFRVEYAVPSRTFGPPLQRGHQLRSDSVLAQCAAVGYTARGVLSVPSVPDELAVECVGLPPYPRQRLPRVAGFVRTHASEASPATSIVYLTGDAAQPRGPGRKIIAHVVNDRARRWAALGFADTLDRANPNAKFFYSTWVLDDPSNLRLGNVHIAPLHEELSVASMVAQAGYGPSDEMRLRYEALETCLRVVAAEARRIGASVHMPKVGTGQGGGRWPVIREILDRVLCRQGIPVSVYSLPGQVVHENGEGITLRPIQRREGRPLRGQAGHRVPPASGFEAEASSPDMTPRGRGRLR